MYVIIDKKKKKLIKEEISRCPKIKLAAWDLCHFFEIRELGELLYALLSKITKGLWLIFIVFVYQQLRYGCHLNLIIRQDTCPKQEQCFLAKHDCASITTRNSRRAKRRKNRQWKVGKTLNCISGILYKVSIYHVNSIIHWPWKYWSLFPCTLLYHRANFFVWHVSSSINFIQQLFYKKIISMPPKILLQIKTNKVYIFPSVLKNK